MKLIEHADMGRAMAIEAELRDYCGDAMEREKRDNWLHTLIGDILSAKYQGKKLTARLATQVKAALPQEWQEKAIVHYGDDYGLCQLSIWAIPGAENYDKRKVFFLAHKGPKSDCFDIATFKENDCCHGEAAVKRNAKRFELCQGDDLPAIAALIAIIEEAKEALNAKLEFGTPAYEITYNNRVRNAVVGSRD